VFPVRSRLIIPTRPLASYGLLAANVLVFLFQLQLTPEAEKVFVFRFGVVPRWFLESTGHPAVLLSAVTSMFVHGNLAHIAGNMWFLWVFSRAVEHALGHARFFAQYILCGLAAVVAQIAIDPLSEIPMVGASGAIAGVVASYVALYPRSRILTVIPIFIFFQFVELPAFFYVFIWFGYQLLMGVTSLGLQTQGGVAFFAHIGGFVAGLVLTRLMARRERIQVRRVRPR